MLDAIKPLLDSGILNEEAKTQIEEAWNSKLEEAKSELRSEFANRYEHDKAVMVEALDKMVTETLAEEVQKISEEKNQLVADRAKFVTEMSNKAGKFDKFLQESLHKELLEFVNDRMTHANAMQKLEKFVVRALAEELSEFAEDKKDLINTKVKLVSEANAKFEELRKQFVARSSKLVQEAVTKTMRAEIGQLKEDINSARQNSFGRRIFEAFASEFSATHLNEHAEIRKLQKDMAAMAQKLAEASEAVEQKSALVEAKNREIANINDTISRQTKLNELMKPLSADKANVMASLLESVATEKLETSFQKYLPAVLNGGKIEGRKAINESVKEVTGDRAPTKAQDSQDSNIVEMRRLAGLTK